MSDTVASVVLAVDIFCIIVAVKVLIRLIAMLGQLPPAPGRAAGGTSGRPGGAHQRGDHRA